MAFASSGSPRATGAVSQMSNPTFYPTRLVFWEPTRSPHKENLFEALIAIAPDMEIVCCAHADLPPERRAQGWSVGQRVSFATVVAPTLEQIDELVREKTDHTLHIFSGVRWRSSIVEGLKAIKRYRAKFAIMSEPRVLDDWRGVLRVCQSWLTEGWLRRHVEFVLAQGRNGPPWFRLAGYANERIFPFAYFVDPPALRSSALEQSLRDTRTMHVGYVGRLITMKGVRFLVEAIAKLGDHVSLTIVGAGQEETRLRHACSNRNVNAVFTGVVPIHEVGRLMCQFDVLVLPSISKSDGWGVVVSEALMSGTAVIATSCVGASVMVDEPLFGRCVPPGDSDAIARAVQELAATDSFSGETRSRRRTLARKLLSAEGGARHLIDILQWKFAGGARPNPFYDSVGSD